MGTYTPEFMVFGYKSLIRVKILYTISILLCSYYLGQLSIVVIKDVDILKEVTVKQFEHFQDRPPAPDLLRKKPGSPRGLFNARGAYRKKIRATLSPFSFASKMKMVNSYTQEE